MNARHIEIVPDRLGGRPTVAGHRYTVGQLIAELADPDGPAVRDFTARWDCLTADEVAGALREAAAYFERRFDPETWLPAEPAGEPFGPMPGGEGDDGEGGDDAGRVAGVLIELGSISGRAAATVELTRPDVQRLAPLLYGRVAIVPVWDDAPAVREIDPEVIMRLIERRTRYWADADRLAAALGRLSDAAEPFLSDRNRHDTGSVRGLADELAACLDDARAALAGHDAADGREETDA